MLLNVRSENDTLKADLERVSKKYAPYFVVKKILSIIFVFHVIVMNLRLKKLGF